MKTFTTLFLLVFTALLFGCGGSSSSDPALPDGTQTDGTQTDGTQTDGTQTDGTQTDGTQTDGTQTDPQTPNTSTFTINSLDDVKGYTISSNESSNSIGGQYTMHQKITLSVKCDGTFDYKIVTSASGVSSTSFTPGSVSDISYSNDFGTGELSWSGTDNDGEQMNGGLTLNADNQLVIGSTCWEDFGVGSGETCPNNLYVESVLKDATCN